jgi:CelD/BcsL family acetyltransferase involved in cellulose biosynthesis
LLATLDGLIARPVTTARRTEEALGVTNRSAQKIIDRLEQNGILFEITGRARNRVYLAQRIIDIIDSPLEETADRSEEGGPIIETGF